MLEEQFPGNAVPCFFRSPLEMEIAPHPALTKSDEPFLHIVAHELLYPHESLNEIGRILTQQVAMLVHLLHWQIMPRRPIPLFQRTRKIGESVPWTAWSNASCRASGVHGPVTIVTAGGAGETAWLRADFMVSVLEHKAPVGGWSILSCLS